MLLPEHSSNRQVLLKGTGFPGTYRLRKTKLRLSLMSSTPLSKGFLTIFCFCKNPADPNSAEVEVADDYPFCDFDSHGQVKSDCKNLHGQASQWSFCCCFPQPFALVVEQFLAFSLDEA